MYGHAEMNRSTGDVIDRVAGINPAVRHSSLFVVSDTMPQVNG